MAKKLNLYQAQQTVGFQREAVYNALDTITTLEIDNVLEARMHPADKRTMNFYLAQQAAALDMTIRGMNVDESEREALVAKLTKERRKVERELVNHALIKPVWDRLEKDTGMCPVPSRKDGKHKWEPGVEDTPERKCLSCGASRMKVRAFKPSSDADLQHLFYGVWGMKPIHNKDHKVTSDREARGRLKERSKKYAPVIEMIDDFADKKKQLEFLSFRSDDGRFHSSFNVSVTNTGRYSSNADAFGRGGNGQNITEKHRHIFTADPGYELCYADLKQAESNVIAHKAGDEGYIEAHLLGDTHTYVCRLVWPEGIKGQEWTWDDIKADKKIATSAAPPWDDKPGHDYRYQSKAIQHGSNLGLTPFGMALQKRIPVEAAREGQRRYFKAFPGIRGYQNFVREKVQNQETIVTPLGVRFKLFGRPWDESTFKEGLAKIPQSMVGHIIGMGLWQIYNFVPEAKLLAQVHDAVLLAYPKGDKITLWKSLQLMKVPVPIEGVDGKTRTIQIEVEAATGHNWAHRSDDNPNGIKEIDLVQLEAEVRELGFPVDSWLAGLWSK